MWDLFFSIWVNPFLFLNSQNTKGGLVGTLAVVPLTNRLGRLRTFLVYFLFSTAAIFFTFTPLLKYPPLIRMILLGPAGITVFGAFAISPFYLPELFPVTVR